MALSLASSRRDRLTRLRAYYWDCHLLVLTDRCALRSVVLFVCDVRISEFSQPRWPRTCCRYEYSTYYYLASAAEQAVRRSARNGPAVSSAAAVSAALHSGPYLLYWLPLYVHSVRSSANNRDGRHGRLLITCFVRYPISDIQIYPISNFPRCLQRIC